VRDGAIAFEVPSHALRSVALAIASR